MYVLTFLFRVFTHIFRGLQPEIATRESPRQVPQCQHGFSVYEVIQTRTNNIRPETSLVDRMRLGY